jgi:hypothetical protein
MMQQLAANLRQNPSIDEHAIRIVRDAVIAVFDSLSGSLLNLTVKISQQYYDVNDLRVMRTYIRLRPGKRRSASGRKL